MHRHSHMTRLALLGMVLIGIATTPDSANAQPAASAAVLRAAPQYGTHPVWNGLRLGEALGRRAVLFEDAVDYYKIALKAEYPVVAVSAERAICDQWIAAMEVGHRTDA